MNIPKNLLLGLICIQPLMACQSTQQHHLESTSNNPIREESLGWYLSEGGRYLVQGLTGFEYDEGIVYEQSVNIWAEIYITDERALRIGFQVFDENCTNYQAYSNDATSLRLNGTKVQMMQQCIHEGVALTYPKTDKGAEYLRTQFENESNDVILTDTGTTVMFSSKNFNYIFKRASEKIGGI
ncbi:hypothetical protein [Vibrio owensii]|uniref:hypothetical protein n=1 Tax=Vibrio owensii TaxID=696485 RepID=UPI0038CE5CB8